MSSPLSADRSLPIGLFDSGMGGLTVARALRERLPDESLLYLGDTARLPYGSKSPETVCRYATQAARLLVDRGVKMLVIACNTASAVALEHLRREFAPLPVVGVIEPGAAAACAASKTGRVLVTGTEGTITGGAYARAILALRPSARVESRACAMFVALAEEGWCDGPIARAVAQTYLDPHLRGSDTGEAAIDCVVLGCTHFPVFRPVLTQIYGSAVTLVDSAETTAIWVERELRSAGLLGETAHSGLELWVTDAPQRFARVGETFIGHPLDPDEVRLVDLPMVSVPSRGP